MSKQDTTMNTIRLDIPVLRIRSNQYKAPQLFYGNNNNAYMALVEISDLDEPIIFEKQVSLIMCFPFENSFSCLISSERGEITKRMIIDHIRSSYGNAYRLQRQPPAKTSYSKKFMFDLISYPLKNLFIESLFYNPSSKQIQVNIDGWEIIEKNSNHPF